MNAQVYPVFLRLEAKRVLLVGGGRVAAGKLPGLLDAVKDAVATDVPRDRLPQLAEAVQNADMSQLQRIVLQPPTYMSVNAHSAAGYILIPNLDAIRAIGEALLTEASPSALASP